MINSRVFFTGLCFLAALLTGCAREEVSTYSTTGTVEARDGVPVVYEIVGEGEVAVVFIHCWACNRLFWQHQVDATVNAGYRVVTLDLPGHGDSRSSRSEWSIAGLAADVDAVVNALDLQQVVLVGHSMSARLALIAASLMPDRVIGVACVDALRNAEFEWPEGAVDAMAEFLASDFRAGVESMIAPVMRPETDPSLVEWIIEQSMASDHGSMIELLKDFPTPGLREHFADADVPVRCINAAPWGSRPAPTEIEINQKYADFDAVLMEGVGHYPQLEQPEAFNLHLLAILAELSEREVP